MLYGIGDLQNSIPNVVNAIAKGNSVDLSPVSTENLLGILGYMGGLSGDEQGKVMNAVSTEINKRANVARETRDLTNQALFLQRLDQIPPEARAMLTGKHWQLGPARFYSSKVVTGTRHVDMYETGDTTSYGQTNLVQAKLPSEDYFLCTAIALYGATLTANTPAALKAADWGKLPSIVRNGEFKWGIGDTTFISGDACTEFNQNRTDMEVGVMILETPKMLYPNRLVDFAIDFADTLGSSTETGLRVELIGVRTRKA